MILLDEFGVDLIRSLIFPFHIKDFLGMKCLVLFFQEYIETQGGYQDQNNFRGIFE